MWSAAGEGTFTWETSEPIRYVDPTGRERAARPIGGEATLEVGSEPYLVISPKGSGLVF